ncbi:MAG TPA: amino acid adenylation domain-containing protein [Pyrinomonadaceae bacterium]
MTSNAFVFPASFAQQRLWFLEQLDPGKSVYNMLYEVKFETRLDLRALEQSLNELVQRHESLRTTFSTTDGQPVQVIAKEMSVELPVVELSRLALTERERERRWWSEHEAGLSFDLAAGPLMRARLLRLSDDESVLLIALHHIVTDGWSMGVLLRELATLYEAYSANQKVTLPELPVQYADYAAWQRDWLQGEELRAQVSYWKRQLEGAPVVLELATDRPRPAIQTFAGQRRYVELPDWLVHRLKRLSNREGVTLFMTLLAAFDVLLWRHSRQDDVVVGTPIAGRNRSELEGLIGFFANTLPLRVDLSGNPRFCELLVRVRDIALDAYAHQDIPFDKLVEELHPERSLSHTPVFQVIFAFENASIKHQSYAFNLNWSEVDRDTSHCDLSLFATEKSDTVSCMWEYSTDLFDAETIDRMILNYQMLLESILENPQERIGYLRTCSDEELQRVLFEWNSLKSKHATEPCIHELFEAQAKKNPDAIALVFGDERLTYRQVNARANQIAHYLRKRDVGPETPVGVCLDRSAEMIVALLSILKAGGAYVPMDPGYPPERLAFMLADSRVPVLITEKRLERIFHAPASEIVWLDECPEIAEESVENPLQKGSPENLAYVIYTSGSTGLPKGVEVSHRTVVHLFNATRDRLGFLEGDIWTVVHSSAFDFSVWEIWGSLLQGGQLVVVPLNVVQSPPELYRLLCRERVTVLNQTPSALRQLLEAWRQQAGKHDWSLRLIVCGGDALDQELAMELIQLEIPVWNFYGPTENTVWTTCTLIEGTLSDNLTSVGRPIADQQVYLLDDYLQPVPIGVPGELFVGGDGLARGYRNRPELTAEKFVPNLFSPEAGKRLYRTGDLARHRSDGKIEFLGRLDTQVKLRGFRVELGEIETVLSQHPNVAQAVVAIRKDQIGDGRLVAYVTALGGTPSSQDLRRFLQLYLPDYMVPAAFVLLDTMPLTPNKKIDRLSLPEPDYSAPVDGIQSVAPQDSVEELLADIWAGVLGLEKIGIYDDFFERGGHSLLATQVVSRIRDAFQVELPLRALFESPFIAGVAEKLRAAIQPQPELQAPSLMPAVRDRKLPLSFAQQRLWFLDQLEPGSPFYNISRAFRLRGPLNFDALSQALNEIVMRHESLRTSFGADDEPFQLIAASRSLPLQLIDVSQLPELLRKDEAERLAAEKIRQPFDLSGDLLLRAGLISFDAEDYLLILILHHIAADGWSLSVLFRELNTLYEAFASEKSPALPALPIQYVDYAVWQRAWLQGEALTKFLAYWQDQLAGAPLVLELPADKPRPAVQSFRGAYKSQTIAGEFVNSLKQLSRSHGASLFMTCLAAFQLLLSRYTGKEDLIVGTDVANRNRVETEGLIGFFTNLLPLRAKISGNLTFVEWLRQVRETTLDAYAHQDLPFDKMVEALKPPRDTSRNPIVQVLLVMQNDPGHQFAMTGLDVFPVELPLESSRFDLVLFLSESESELTGLWLYNPDLFEPATVANMMSHFERLLNAIVQDPTSNLDDYEFLTADEIKQKEIEKQEKQASHINRLRHARRRGVDLTKLQS